MLTHAELDRYAETYYLAPDIADHDLEHAIQRHSIPRILRHVPRPGRILELGYGDGLLTEALTSGGYDVELLEGSPLLCRRAAARHPDLTIHQALFETFAPPAPLAAVLALHVLEHVDDPAALLRHMATWLTPAGSIVIVVPNRASIHRRLALRMGLIAALDELSQRDHLVGHRRVYDYQSLEADVRAAGLRPSRRFGSFVKPLSNGQMLGFAPALIEALDAISDDVPPELTANIGLVVTRPT